MSTIKTKKVQVGTDSTASNNFTIYQPATPDGTLRIGNGNADSVTDAITLDSSGNITAAQNLTISGDLSVTGNIPVNNTAPAFGAWKSASTSISSATWTKVDCNTEEFDTNSNYDNSTNYRFTPTVAGYYQINANINYETSSSITRMIASIRKNGTEHKRGNDLTGVTGLCATVSSIVYLNGSTDYVELWAYATGTGLQVSGGYIWRTYFNGTLARAA